MYICVDSGSKVSFHNYPIQRRHFPSLFGKNKRTLRLVKKPEVVVTTLDIQAFFSLRKTKPKKHPVIKWEMR